MIGKIFQEMPEIRENGSIRLTVDFGSGRTHDVIAIPVIQVIIGDCKVNDVLCGRKGGNSINMKSVCRDYDMQPSDGNDTCIGEYLNCTFHNLGNAFGKTKEELDKYSFLPINNYFHNISFGGCERNIYVLIKGNSCPITQRFEPLE